MWTIDKSSTIDSFLASYNYENTNIFIYIVFKNAFGPRKFSGHDILNAEVSEYYTPNWCNIIKSQRIIISFNPVDAIFNSNNVTILNNSRLLHGEEVSSDHSGDINTAETLPHQTYDLSHIGHIKRFKPYFGLEKEAKAFNHPTFTYRFNLTCQELENSTLVIDGLSHHGKQIPPLRVRLNFYYPSKVPAYTGPTTNSDNGVSP